MAAAWEEVAAGGIRRPYYQVIDGVKRCPSIVPEYFRAGVNFRPSAGDILQSSHPKCGTHWVQYITQLILKEGKEPVKDYGEFNANSRAVDYWKHEDWKPKLPVRLYYTHQPLCWQAMNPEAKYVFIARNPWDVCVSFYHMVSNVSIWRFQDGTFDEFVDAFIEGDFGYGSYFDHVAAAYALRDEPNVFFLTYENLKKDTRGTVLRLARFLGDKYIGVLEENEDLLQNILGWSKPDYMRNVMVVNFHNKEAEEWNELSGINSVSCKEGHEGNEIKYSFVRKAKVGGWKEHFTPDQLTRLEKKIRDEGDKAAFMDLFKDIREEAASLSNVSL
ncbi:3-alpha-hydroxysteroid sulfotransferase-like [Haemaphysalis longicornis]